MINPFKGEGNTSTGKMINPLKTKEGGVTKTMSLKEIFGTKEDLMGKVIGEKKDE